MLDLQRDGYVPGVVVDEDDEVREAIQREQFIWDKLTWTLLVGGIVYHICTDVSGNNWGYGILTAAGFAHKFYHWNAVSDLIVNSSESVSHHLEIAICKLLKWTFVAALILLSIWLLPDDAMEIAQVNVTAVDAGHFIDHGV